MSDSKLRAFGRDTRAFVYAILIHAALLALLFLSLNLSPTTLHAPPSSAAEPVQATVLDEAQIEREVERLKVKEAEKQRREDEAQKRLAETEKKRQQEEKRVAELEQRRKEEQERAKALEEQRKLEEVKLSKLKAEQEQRKREEEARKKQQEEERRKEEEKQKLAKKKEEEDKRRKEKECDAELAKAKGKKTLDAAARKRLDDLCAPAVVKKMESDLKEEEKRQKEIADKQRRDQEIREAMEREANERAAQSALSRYVPMIRQKVQRHWTWPPGSAAGMSAQVRVNLTPTGEVISAEVVGSSGNPIFDRSVETAVRKAAPLPIPTESGVNERFRDIQFLFKPE